MGAFWEGRYRTTLIQDGDHLSRCLFYIEMNMVRTGVVTHPRDWEDIVEAEDGTCSLA